MRLCQTDFCVFIVGPCWWDAADADRGVARVNRAIGTYLRSVKFRARTARRWRRSSGGAHARRSNTATESVRQHTGKAATNVSAHTGKRPRRIRRGCWRNRSNPIPPMQIESVCVVYGRHAPRIPPHCIVHGEIAIMHTLK
jgi:hypothetical protein